jgi:hypothetical protein
MFRYLQIMAPIQLLPVKRELNQLFGPYNSLGPQFASLVEGCAAACPQGLHMDNSIWLAPVVEKISLQNSVERIRPADHPCFINKPCNSYCRKSRTILMSRPIRCNAQPRCCICSSTNDTCFLAWTGYRTTSFLANHHQWTPSLDGVARRLPRHAATAI